MPPLISLTCSPVLGLQKNYLWRFYYGASLLFFSFILCVCVVLLLLLRNISISPKTCSMKPPSSQNITVIFKLRSVRDHPRTLVWTLLQFWVEKFVKMIKLIVCKRLLSEHCPFILEILFCPPSIFGLFFHVLKYCASRRTSDLTGLLQHFNGHPHEKSSCAFQTFQDFKETAPLQIKSIWKPIPTMPHP